MNRDRNRWRIAKCRFCGKPVEPGEGYAMGRPGAWTGAHHDCLPANTDRYEPWPLNITKENP